MVLPVGLCYFCLFQWPFQFRVSPSCPPSCQSFTYQGLGFGPPAPSLYSSFGYSIKTTHDDLIIQHQQALNFLDGCSATWGYCFPQWGITRAFRSHYFLNSMAIRKESNPPEVEMMLEDYEKLYSLVHNTHVMLS